MRPDTFPVTAAALLIVVTISGPVAAQDEGRPIYKTNYRVVNVHRHYYEMPTEKVIESELEVMDRVGVDVMVILILGRDGTAPEFPRWMELQRKYANRLVVFGSVDFRKIKRADFFTEIVRDLRLQHKMGIRGVKLWKDLGMTIRDGDGKLLKADDPRLDPFWSTCVELGLPVIFHCADPKEYWSPLTYNSFHYGMDRPRHYDNPGMPGWNELIRQRDSVLKKHPKLTMIGAHLGSQTFDLHQLGLTLDKYPNFHVECAARLRILGRLNPKAVRDFFVKYQDRILFGTDWNILYDTDSTDEKSQRRLQEKATRFYGRYLEYFETDRTDLVEPYGHASQWLRLAGPKLPPEVLEKFYHKNAERLIPGLPTGMPPHSKDMPGDR